MRKQRSDIHSAVLLSVGDCNAKIVEKLSIRLEVSF